MEKKALIPAAQAKRPLGIDTTQTAIGRLPQLAAQQVEAGAELTLSREEYLKVLRVVNRHVKKTQAKPAAIALDLSGHKVELTIRVSDRPGDEPDIGVLDATREYRFDVLCSTLYHTMLLLRMQKDGNGCFWINARMNPTSTALGYNAAAIAIEGVSQTEERARLLRLPYELLDAVLRAADSKFSWSKSTRSRIEALLFKACPIQIFTYIDPQPFSLPQFLGFLRVLLSCPLGDGKGNFSLLADLLGVEVDVRAPGGPVQTFLLRFKSGDRQALSVCLYDKLAAAQADATRAKVEVGDASIKDQLGRLVRVDMTLQEPMVRELFGEAKLNTKGALTAKNLNEAMRLLNTGKGKSGKKTVVWLLTEIFERRLHLVSLRNFRPSMIDEAREKLKTLKAKAVKVFDEWYEAGFGLRLGTGDRVSFQEFAVKHAQSRVSKQTARTIRKTCLKIGLDLDVPLQAYLAVFNMSFFFNLSDGDREQLAVALEAKDMSNVETLLTKAKSNTSAISVDLGKTLTNMIENASAPAVRIGKKKKSKRKRKSRMLSKTIV